ncbi:hypothetical protein GQ457_05G033860 [Hibiscus cannabinus]
MTLVLHMHGELGALEEDPASLISVADRITVTVIEFSNTMSITDRWRNKEDRALGSSDRGDSLCVLLFYKLTILIRFGVGISSRSRDTVLSNVFIFLFSPRMRFLVSPASYFPKTRKSSPPTLLYRRSSDRASIAVRVIHDSHHGVPLFFPSPLTPPSTRSTPPFASNGCETVSIPSLRPYLHLGRCGSC